jgi:hypothetical protein
MAPTVALASRTDIDPDQLPMPPGALVPRQDAATKLLNRYTFFAPEPGSSRIYLSPGTRAGQRRLESPAIRHKIRRL